MIGKPAVLAACALLLGAWPVAAQSGPCARNRVILARDLSRATAPALSRTEKPLFDSTVAALRRGDDAGAARLFGALSRLYFAHAPSTQLCPLVNAAVRAGSVEPNPRVRAGVRAIEAWNGKLDAVGDDAQLANVDLQNALQKQQQTLQMLSSISKLLHDSAMAVVRKIGG